MPALVKQADIDKAKDALRDAAELKRAKKSLTYWLKMNDCKDAYDAKGKDSKRLRIITSTQYEIHGLLFLGVS